MADPEMTESAHSQGSSNGHHVLYNRVIIGGDGPVLWMVCWVPGGIGARLGQ